MENPNPHLVEDVDAAARQADIDELNRIGDANLEAMLDAMIDTIGDDYTVDENETKIPKPGPSKLEVDKRGRVAVKKEFERPEHLTDRPFVHNLELRKLQSELHREAREKPKGKRVPRQINPKSKRQR